MGPARRIYHDPGSIIPKLAAKIFGGSRAVSGYRNPVPTVDLIIEIRAGEIKTGEIKTGETVEEPGIVLIRRKNPPGGWALPGGFVDYGESLETAARREAREETGLDVRLVEQFHVYSAPDRDPRQHTLTVVFLARAGRPPQAADDAAEAGVFFRDRLPSPLAFDHGRILSDYFRYRDGEDRRAIFS